MRAADEVLRLSEAVLRLLRDERQSRGAAGRQSQDVRQNQDVLRVLQVRHQAYSLYASGAWAAVRRGTAQARSVHSMSAADSCRERPLGGGQKSACHARFPVPRQALRPEAAAEESASLWPCRQGEDRSAASPCGGPEVPVAQGAHVVQQQPARPELLQLAQRLPQLAEPLQPELRLLPLRQPPSPQEQSLQEQSL